MKSVRVTVGIEHRFHHDPAEPPVPLNDLAKLLARPILDPHEIPELDLVATVWKVPEGAEMSLPDKCAGKLIALGYAVDLDAPAVVAAPAAPAVVEPAPEAPVAPEPAPAAPAAPAIKSWS